MRKLFLVSVELDQVPGAMHTAENARANLQGILENAIGHYYPEVVLAPDAVQPIEALPQRANDYLLDLGLKSMGDYDNFDRINLTVDEEQARLNRHVFKGILNDPNIALDPETIGTEPAKARVILHPAIAGYLKRSAAELMEPQTPAEAKQRMLETPNMFQVAPGTKNYDDLSDVEKDLYANPKYLEKLGTVKVSEDKSGLVFDINQTLEERARMEGLLREPTDEELQETVEYTEGNAGLD